MPHFTNPHDALRYHVTGAIERGEGFAIVEQATSLRTAYPAPIAYTFEADHHCPRCTAERFGVDEHGSIPESATDREGNGVGAVAPWDEWIEPSEEGPQTLACGTCGEIIETYNPS